MPPRPPRPRVVDPAEILEIQVKQQFHGEARELALAELADHQHRAVSTTQLHALGLGPGAIEHRRRLGRLHRRHRGVYLVGTATPTPQGARMAALLAYGDDAAIGFRTAGAMHDLRGTDQLRIDVIVPRLGIRSRKGIHVHCTDYLHPEDVTTIDRIPVTSVSRTILDLASILKPDQLMRVLERAVQLQVLNLIRLEAAMARVPPRHRGCARLNAALADYREPLDFRSKFERDFYALVKRAGLPGPQVNVFVEGFRVDCFWPEARLVVELDGRAYHTAPRAFEQDRLESNLLQRRGYRVLRITYRRLQRDPAGVVEELEAFLRPAAPTATQLRA